MLNNLFTVATVSGTCGYILGLMSRILDKLFSAWLEDRKEKKKAVEATAAKLLADKRRLFEVMGSIHFIDNDLPLPDAIVADPRTARYFPSETERVGRSLEIAKGHLIPLMDLPEARQLYQYKFPVVLQSDPDIETALTNSYKNGFLPLQAMYRKLKQELTIP